MAVASNPAMIPDEAYIRELTRDVWSTVLGLEIVDGPAGWPDEQETVSAVEVTGRWDGTVAISFSDTLGKRLTAALFACPEAEATPDLVRDALGELANVIGGNVKAMLPGPSKLSLPSVQTRSRAEGFSSGARGREHWFVCHGSPLCVTVRTRNVHAQPEGVSP